MKYLFVLLLAVATTSCCKICQQSMKPNHLGFSPSVELEISDGKIEKVKPKIQTTVDWNF